jgi:hypothetical protein
MCAEGGAAASHEAGERQALAACQCAAGCALKRQGVKDFSQIRKTHSLPRYSSNTHSRGSTAAAALKACCESRQLFSKSVDARCASLQRAEHSGGVHCTCQMGHEEHVVSATPQPLHSVYTHSHQRAEHQQRRSSLAA